MTASDEITRLRNALADVIITLDDIATEDGNGYCGQRARGALKDARKALEPQS